MSEYSKPLRKTNEASKKLIMDLLNGKETHGIDIDSLFYHQTYGWVIIEFLKCETVKPIESHPNRYWWKNWKKFWTLWKLTKALEGKLYLINYSENYEDKFMLIEVIKMDKNSGITKQNKKELTFEELKEWYQELNSKAALPDP